MKSRYVFVATAAIGIFLGGCHRPTAVKSCCTEFTAGAMIQFEKSDCNLRSIGPNTSHLCVFKFKNPGNDTLKITEVRRLRACDTYELSDRTFKPGESGTLEMWYNARQTLGTVNEDIHIKTNDKNNPEITLAIKAVIEDKISYEPRHATLAFDKANAGMPQIQLVAKDKRPFSILKCMSTNDCIVISINPAAKAQEFTLKPSVDMQRLRKLTQGGQIQITLDHPDCPTITIPFTAMPEFKVTPASLTIVNAEPNKSVIRQFEVSSNYDQAFTVDSVRSEKGAVRLVEQTKTAKGYRFNVELTPPAQDAAAKTFKDTLLLNIKGDRQIAIDCIGFYSSKTMKLATTN